MTGYKPKNKLGNNRVPPSSGSAISGQRTDIEPGRIWLTLSRKYRVAQYESLSVDLGASTSLEPNESHSAAHKRVFKDLLESFADVVEVMRDREGI